MGTEDESGRWIEEDSEPLEGSDVSFKIAVCQSCKGSLIEFLNLGFQPPTLGFLISPTIGSKTLYPLRISRCQSCGLIQSGFATDPDILFGGEYFYNSGATASFAKHLEDLSKQMMNRLEENDLVVDIGSNDGTALLPYQEAGFRVLGVDPSSVGAKAKVPTLNKFFSKEIVGEILNSHGMAKLITAFNVFAHVANLDSFMRAIQWLLRDDGIFLTESQYLVDIVEKLGYDTMYLEHLRYYSLHTLISLLTKYGFEVFDAERIRAIGGSIRVFARKKRRHGISPNVQRLLDLEDDYGLQDFELYSEFAARVHKNKIELNALLWNLKKEGNKIVGIGAPGRSTTIINYCGLGPDLIDYLVETSSLKIGKFSPGMEIPVVSEERFLKDQPDYAINFVWHLPQVAEKLREKGFRGKVIQPLPRVEIL